MPSEYRAGDKVRVVKELPIFWPKIGDVGEYLSETTRSDDHGPCCKVEWKSGSSTGLTTRVPLSMLELVSPAVEPAPFASQGRHWTQTLEPAAAVKVCSSECEERMAAIDRQNKQIGELHAKLNEATGAKLRVGDIMGENEHLRSRVAELESALGFAERELCRMKQKAGRK